MSNFAEHEQNVKTFVKNSEWRILNSGVCKGILTGGYTRNFAMLTGGKYFAYDKSKSYILLLEDHEKFSSTAAVSSYISHIEQHEFISNVTGLIFGHYSENVPEDLLKRLERFGVKYNVPVIYSDDFGHGVNHAVLPIGENAELDTDSQSLTFC
jgi:muramoyltetrapeptide carboxypeptidase